MTYLVQALIFASLAGLVLSLQQIILDANGKMIRRGVRSANRRDGDENAENPRETARVTPEAFVASSLGEASLFQARATLGHDAEDNAETDSLDAATLDKGEDEEEEKKRARKKEIQEAHYAVAWGINRCPEMSRPVPKSHCIEAVKAVLPYGSTWTARGVVDGSWDDVPPGCSFQSGGDDSVHYNQQSSGSKNDDYSLVCGKMYDFEKINSSVRCNVADEDMGEKVSVWECASAVEANGGSFFVFGTGDNVGKCRKENTTWVSCREGWVTDNYDFYAIKSKVTLSTWNPYCATNGTNGLCEACINGTYLTVSGECLWECPPGSYEMGTGNEGRCITCDGESRRRRASECTPCSSNGHIGKHNSDDCQNLQDTCNLNECLDCLTCMNETKPYIQQCLQSRGGKGGKGEGGGTSQPECIDDRKMWCPRYMQKLSSCEGFSLGCYYKLMCHDERICPEWKTVRCGGSETNAQRNDSLASLQLGANAQRNKRLSSRMISGRLSVSDRNAQGSSLDDALKGKCAA